MSVRRPVSFGRRKLLVAAGSSVTLPATALAQAANTGVALVIGNSKYRWEAALPNVRRDVADVARAFQALGLKTELVQDADRSAMTRAVETFAAAARGANFAAFYYAGHGASWEKETFLVPVDADLADSSVARTLPPVTAVTGAMQGAARRLLVFDNCRNNPADGWRQREAMIAAGVTKFAAASAALHGPNSLVLFSTAPGRVAVDGPAGQNSPFASMFLRQLSGATVDVQALPARLRRDLLIATEGRQLLWDQSTFDQPFVLSRASGRAVPVDRLQPGPAMEIVELDKAYAFARAKGLSLPAGLVALRPAGGAPEGEKVGSFQTNIKVMIGSIISPGNTAIEPLLLIVLCVHSGGTAEIVVSTKDWAQGGDVADGKVWRYIAGTVSGKSLDFLFLRSSGSSQERPHSFRWKDAASGTYTFNPNYLHTASFSRLD